MPKDYRFYSCNMLAVFLALLLTTFGVSAGTIVWSGASGTDTNWSNGNNWFGAAAPGGGDDVKLYDAGTNLTAGVPNSLMDAGFAGYIGSLQFGQSNGFHTIQISAGQNLNITNTGGVFVGTLGDVGAARVLTNSVKGAGATLNISNVTANLVLNQGQASANGSRAILDLSGLDNFNANISAIGIGSIHFQNAVAQRNSGILFLARTNNIKLSLVNTLANYNTVAALTNSIELVHVGAGNNASVLSYIYLGQTNALYVDSIGIGKSKASASSGATMQFNPAFSSPSAYFRGVGGNASRVTWWSIADMADNASSAQLSIATNDFSLGTVDALVETMSLGRDCSPQHTSSGINVGVLTFTAGTINVNTLYAGNQSLGPNSSFAGNLGIVNVNGSAATLVVNSNLILGRTSWPYQPGVIGGGTNAWKTQGILNIRNGGTVLASSIGVGSSSSNCVVTISNATLVVSNNIASSAKGLTYFAVTNAILHLNITGITNIFCTNLVSAGVSNLISPDSVAVFASYPKQIQLIKYTTQLGLGVTNFALTNLPASAPGAYLSNNIANSSLDLVLPTDPRPIITSGPVGYSGNPGDNVTSSFAVTVANGSGAALTYRWYYFTNSATSTNLLADGPGPSGASTLANSATANLVLNNAQPADNGNYFVTVSNTYGVATSGLAVLNISSGCVAPLITGPNNQTVIQGNNATFSATVSANPAAYQQWQTNGVDVPGANGNSITLNNVQYPANDQEVISLIATNPCGNVTNFATLTVIVPPAISAQPASLVVTNTQSASFSVTASGVPTPTYQWNKNGSPISGASNSTATNATFVIASTASADSATYNCTIVNSAGSTNSASVTLTVNSTMSITSKTPSNGQTGVCYDTPLYVTFSTAPTLRAGAGVGTIKIYNLTNGATPVDTIDLSLGATQTRAIGGDSFNAYPVIITGSTAAIYHHSGVMTSNQTYYVTIDDGVFADASGAYFAGITANNVWQFTTKVGGPANPTSLVVAADGSGDFMTVQGAVDSVPANNTTPTVINLRNGFYQEIVDVKSKNNLDFRGQSRTGAFIGYPNNNALNTSGAPLRAMFVLNGNDCSFENLTLTNTTPSGGSQAEAIDVEGTRATFYNMELDSYQDTFLVHSAGKLVYFQDSLIQGQTDFNWGYGSVYYTNCELRCLLSGGHVTQPRSPATTNGFGFINCRITQGYAGSANFDLGRTISTPSSPSETLFYNCVMADVVTGYASDAGVNMADYGSSNLTATATKSLTFSTHSTSSDPFVIAIQSASTWLYGWQPALAPNITSQPANQSASYGQSASFTVAATGIPAPTYQWLQNGSPLSGATSSTLAIANAVRTNGGNYSVVVNNGSGSVTSSVATLTYNNTAPVASPAGYVMAAGYPFKIALTNLSANWSDVDGDTIALTSTISSTNSATVSYDASYIYYNNPNGVNDQINYTIGDGLGGTAAGLINLTVSTNPLAGTPQAITITGSSATLNLAGIPTYQYEIQRSTNLVDWVTIETTNAPSNGLFQFIDTFTDLGGIPPATAYYRTAQP